MGLSFEEAMALKNGTGQAAPAPAPVSFEEAMALKSAPVSARSPREYQSPENPQTPSLNKTMRGRYQPSEAAEPEFTFGDKATDLARSAGGDLSNAAEFLIDTSQTLLNPSDWGERHEAGKAATQTADSDNQRGFIDRVSALPKYLAGFASHDTAANKAIEEGLSSSMYDEQIPEGESDTLDALKRATGLAIDIGMTGGAGGRSGKQALKTFGSLVTGGTVGGEMYGEGGEIAGVITGALAREPKALAALVDMLGNSLNRAGGAIKQGKRKFWSGNTADSASDEEIREGMRVILRNLTEKDGSGVTAETIEGIMPRLEAAIRNGEKGTMAQLLDDVGLRQMETDIAGAGVRTGVGTDPQTVLNQIDAGINQDAVEAVTDIAKGADASKASVLPKSIVRERKREIQEATDVPRVAQMQAEAAEGGARAPFEAAPDEAAAGMAIAEKGNLAKAAAFDKVKAKWKAVDAIEETIQAKELREHYKVGLRTALDDDKNLIAGFEADFPETVKRINNLEGEVTLEALSSVLSKLSKESVGTSTSPEVINAVKEALYSTIETGSKPRRAAAKAYREYMDIYDPKAGVGKALEGEAELAGGALVKPKLSGGVALKKTLDAIGSKAEAANVLRDRFRQAAMVDGSIDPKKAADFQRNYESSLNIKGLEAVRDEVAEAASRADALRSTTSEADTAFKQAGKDAAAIDRSPLGKYAATGATYEEAITAAKNSMQARTGKDLVAGLDDLVKSTKGKPEFQDIRRSFADDLFNKMFDSKGTLKGGGRKGALKQFQNKREAYEQSGLFTKAELDNIEKQFTEGQKMFLGEGERMAKLQKPERRIQQVVASLVGAKVGAQAFGSPLIGAALGRKFAVDQLSKLTDEKASKLAFELTTNPDKYVEWVKKLSRPDASAVEIRRDMSGLLDAAMKSARISLIGDDE